MGPEHRIDLEGRENLVLLELGHEEELVDSEHRIELVGREFLVRGEGIMGPEHIVDHV